MSQDISLDRWETTTAAIGLRGAYKRGMDAYRDLIPKQEIAGVSVVEFVVWACALDERLSRTDPKYAARRDADKQGQLLPALRFARDRQMHQIAITTALVFTFEGSSDPNVTPDLLRVRNRWRPLDALPEATDGHQNNYKEHLEGRWPALATA